MDAVDVYRAKTTRNTPNCQTSIPAAWQIPRKKVRERTYMNPALRLSSRHALDAMHTRLVL